MSGPAPELTDLMHLGRAQVIGAWRVGAVVVDPGPASCLPALLGELEADPPRALALTHIHLDHAGAAGTLARRFPGLEVWVHERGAPHLIDPSRLLASATRLYGERMQELWGEVLPVPAEQLRVMHGGETLLGLRVAYTPGHAAHHVSYLHEQSGWAFTGDVAGVRIGAGPVLAPTPPPDIDLPAWRRSLELIEAWQPSRLAVTHFGAHSDPGEQIEQMRAYLAAAEALVRAGGGPELLAADLRARVGSGDEALERAYTQAMPADQSYAGLSRYIERAGREGARTPGS